MKRGNPMMAAMMRETAPAEKSSKEKKSSKGKKGKGKEKCSK